MQQGDHGEKQSLFGGIGTLQPGTSVSGSLGPSSDARSGDSLGQIITNPTTRQGNQQEDEPTQLTAIFRPDEAWREKLRQAHSEAAMRQNAGYMTGGMSGLNGQDGSGWDLGMGPEDSSGVIGASVEDEDDDDSSSLLGDDSGKKWKVRKTLRNHLDAVRALAFHPKEMILASGGDDLTIKIWRMDAAQLASASAGRTIELEPQVTLRGHSEPITSIVVAPHRGFLYSGSLDSTIRVWLIPPPQHSTYSPYEPLTTQGELVGHTDAVWGLAVLREGSLLVSCSADGTVKVWDITSTPGALRLTWGYNGVGVDSASGSDEKDVIGATTVEAIKTNLKWIAVGYKDGVVKIFDVETGKEVAAMQAEDAETSQVNAITSHPALPLLVVGYEDKNIRVFDISTFTCTHSMLSHLDA
ncbi:hypothetical protein FRC17_009007, partial [Serendipita sp. 399]